MQRTREYGSRAVIYKGSLLSHGYTFIAKAVSAVWIPKMQHEATMYRLLEVLQGQTIPVFLGVLDLRPINQVLVVKNAPQHRFLQHLSLLSWGGPAIRQLCGTMDDENLWKFHHLANDAFLSMHAHQAVHGQAKLTSMLYSFETGGIMLVSLESAKFIDEPPRYDLPRAVESPYQKDLRMAWDVVDELFSALVWSEAESPIQIDD
ncbi:hypothetical protein XA68_17890 [Ophiocordyceps unilateralis]|uniref:Protein kinase domain-containing protein n=1 Tax=Ophiocordyceps unilateralis TaxID=268505 RepID=A0A2A9PKB4_OPHUN|nr:hypothetical protein XA68_17890 [Ophiocordyceps unilateralis]